MWDCVNIPEIVKYAYFLGKLFILRKKMYLENICSFSKINDYVKDLSDVFKSGQKQ